MKIKPLKWKMESETCWVAHTFLKDIYIMRYITTTGEYIWKRFSLLKDKDKRHRNLESAIAAATKDYEQWATKVIKQYLDTNK